MHITLTTMQGDAIAQVPVTTDEHGYLYADHATLGHEVECALYGYQEGGINTDVIEDENGVAYIRWSVIE
jgi:hypothetical protein